MRDEIHLIEAALVTQNAMEPARHIVHEFENAVEDEDMSFDKCFVNLFRSVSGALLKRTGEGKDLTSATVSEIESAVKSAIKSFSPALDVFDWTLMDGWGKARGWQSATARC